MWGKCCPGFLKPLAERLIMSYEAKLVRDKGREFMYAVVPAGEDPSPENAVGVLTKFKDTRTEKHPWKAFVGVGERIRHIGAFYPEDGVKEAALEAVLASAGIVEKTIWNSDGTDGPVLICPPSPPKGHENEN